MRSSTRSRAAAVITTAALLAGCGALNGDAPAPVGGLFDGANAASAYDGEVVVTEAELRTLLEEAFGPVDPTDVVADEALDQRLSQQLGALQFLLETEILTYDAQRLLGVEVGAADVEAEVERIAEQVGGMDELAAALEERGQRIESFPIIVRSQLVQQDVAEALAAEDSSAAPEQLVASWAAERLAAADPVVATRFGTWSESQQRILPFGETQDQL